MAYPTLPPDFGQQAEDAYDQAEIERQMRLMFPQGPPRPAVRPASPDLRLGPLRLPGEGVDAASLAILQALQNAPPSRNGLGGFAQGFAGGYAGARARQYGKREADFEMEKKRVQDEQEAQRSARSQAASHLATERWRMARENTKLAAELEKRDAAAAAAQEKQQRDFEHREKMQQLRFNGQMQIATARAQMPESPGKRKALSLMVTRMAMNDPDAKEFVIVRDFHNQGIQSLKAKDSFGDLMAIRALAKVSDKLTGIREGEYDTFANAVGVLVRKGILVKSMVGRGMLTDTGRAALARELNTIYDQKKKHYGAAKEFYEGLAGSMELDPTLVMRDLAGEEKPQAETFDWDKP